MTQHKTPCKACPYRRNSLKGYLGECSGDPTRFLEGRFAHEKHECHSKVDYDDHDSVDQHIKEAASCAGFAIMCKNMAKLPYNEATVRLIEAVEIDRDTVFSHTNEFIEHHSSEKIL